MLIVLDNCEHLIEPVAGLVQAILERCPRVRILATSREALAVPGEVQLPVWPLPVPPPGTPTRAGPGLPGGPAVPGPGGRGAPRPDRRTRPTLAAVAVICRRLDGIPLALELAAARLAGLQPLELADRVRDRFAVLTSGDRTAEARQRTLRSAVDWSHDLLTGSERVLFRRLAVFRGGWTLTAAEAVVTDTELPAERRAGAAGAARSAVAGRSRPGQRHTRYRMLETLRQYATGKLDRRRRDDGDGRGACHATSWRWANRPRPDCAALAQARWFGHAAGGTREPAGSAELDGGDRRAGRPGPTAGRVAGPVLASGPSSGGSGGAAPGDGPARRFAAVAGPGDAGRVAGRASPRVHRAPQRAVRRRRAGKPRHLPARRGPAPGRVLRAAAGRGRHRGGAHPDADAALQHADTEFAALGDDWGRAVAAFVRMEKLTYHADLASVRAAAADATARFRALRDGWGLSAVLYHYGWALTRFGVPADAVPVLQEAIDVASAAGVYNTVQWATADLGLALLGLGRVDEAAAYFTRAGTARDEVGDDAGTVLRTYGEAVLTARPRGDHRRRSDRCSPGRMTVSSGSAWPSPTGLALAGIAACDERLGDTGVRPDGYQRLLLHAESSGEMGLTAAALEGLARAALTDRDPAGAAELLARAAAIRDTYDRPASPSEAAATAATVAAVDRALSETVDPARKSEQRPVNP